jgi:L-histidine N-alpha-methyltransferase
VSEIHLDRFAEVLEATNPRGYLCIVGEEQSSKLSTLVQGLSDDESQTGDSKQIASGFSYWGIGPTLAWDAACRDHLYHVMRDSIRNFSTGWKAVRHSLGTGGFHYVSLGVGTGQKDVSVITDLKRSLPGMFYLPVDMSPEMLTLGVQECAGLERVISKRQTLAIQLDFSDEDNIRSLRTLLDQTLGDDPILFSLLGNTLANFDSDSRLLKILTQLLAPDDRMLLEVAFTSRTDLTAAQLAAKEYRSSPKFQDFALSSLIQYTNIPIQPGYLLFRGEAEGDRAVQIKVLYQNKSSSTIHFLASPNRASTISFPPKDTIRLYLSRKYSKEGIEATVRDNDLTVLAEYPHTSTTFYDGSEEYTFGVYLFTLARQQS